jgi:hypothetical protein
MIGLFLPNRSKNLHLRQHLGHVIAQVVLLIFLASWGGVRLSRIGTWATNWPIVPIPDDRRCECEAVGGMIIDRGNRSTRRKPAPVPLY